MRSVATGRGANPLSQLPFYRQLVSTPKVKRVAALGLLVMMGLTYPVWQGNVFNPVPVFSWLTVKEVVHVLSFIAIVAWATFVFAYPKGTWQGVMLLLFIGWSILLDRNRCQVWLIHFLYLFLLPEENDEEQTALALTFLIALTYLFSGLNKYNPGFEMEIVPWLLMPFGVHRHYPFFAFLVPALEVVLGIGMCVPKISRWANGCGIVMHGLIIYILLYYHWNPGVIPWNLILIYYQALLLGNGPVNWKLPTIGSGVLMGVFFVIPTLAYLRVLPKIFSFPLYSGDQYTGIVVFSEAAQARLPANMNPFIERLKDTGEPYIHLDRYALAQQGVPLFQDLRCYWSATKCFLPFTRSDDDLVLLVRNGTQFIFDKDLWAYTLPEIKTESEER